MSYVGRMKNYGALIDAALATVGKGEHHQEAVARGALSYLFHEAALAVDVARGKGFPLELNSTSESFSLRIGGSYGPCFNFDRFGMKLNLRTYFMPASIALNLGAQASQDWTPSNMETDDGVRKMASDWVELAIATLSRAQALSFTR